MKILSNSITLLAACGFIGCAPTNQPLAPTSSNSWESKNFTVRFSAGEKSFGDHKSTSRYEVIPTRLGVDGRLIASSAHSTNNFASVTDPEPTHYIKIVVDSESEALLIDETIPNECGPCSNYIWIRPDGPSTFTHSFLQIPSRTNGDSGGINYEFPKVVSLQHGKLTYRYSTGPAVSVMADSVPSAQEPSQP